MLQHFIDVPRHNIHQTIADRLVRIVLRAIVIEHSLPRLWWNSEHMIARNEIQMSHSERISVLHNDNRLEYTAVGKLLVRERGFENIRFLHLVGLDASDVSGLRGVQISDQRIQLYSESRPDRLLIRPAGLRRR